MIVLSNLFRRVMQYMIWGLPGFGSFDPKRSAQIMDLCEIDVANVVGAVVGSNLSARPVKAFDPEFRARLEGFHHRNVRVPTIVGLYLCRFGGRLEIGVKATLGITVSFPRCCKSAPHDCEPFAVIPMNWANYLPGALTCHCDVLQPGGHPVCAEAAWKLREKL
jgi:hypothetical protein